MTVEPGLLNPIPAVSPSPCYTTDIWATVQARDSPAQPYLTVEEEKAVRAFLLLISSCGQPVRVKSIPMLAFSIARRRSPTLRPIKPPGEELGSSLGETPSLTQGEKSPIVRREAP